MNDILFIFLVLTLGFGGLFGIIHLINRSSKAQEKTGRPSRLIRISALLIGLGSLAALVWWEVSLPWFVPPLSLVLVAYGLLGLFGSVRPRPK